MNNNSNVPEESASPTEENQSAAPNEGRRTYATPQDIKKYAKLKDFYELLGVSKTATEEEIKRNYKRLALKFHPDKCRQPGALQVFKKIATAYDCLTNKDKRATYDRYGNEQPEQHYQHYRQQYHDDIDPNDIFSFFFGGQNPFFDQMGGGRGQRTYYYSSGGFGGGRNNGGENRNGAQPQQRGSQIFQLMQLLPVFIILFSGPLLNLLKEDPLYAMNYSWSYSVKRGTKLLNVPYFVGTDFREKISRDPGILLKVDRQIEEEHIRELRNTCYYQQQIQYQYNHQAQMSRNQRDKEAYVNRADRVDMRTCNLLQQYQEDYNIGQQYP